MKTVEFKGVYYEVEDWVRFITLDCDGGLVWAWESRPHEEAGNWFCHLGQRKFVDYNLVNESFKEV